MNQRRIAMVLGLASVMLSAHVKADPSYSQLENIISTRGIPHWQDDAKKIAEVHSNLPSQAFSDAWASLDSGVDLTRGVAPLAQATNPHSADELLIYSTWLRYQILVNNADGRYSYAYAFDLGHMRDDDGSNGYLMEAATMLYDARIAMEIDGARCPDKSGVDHVTYGFEGQPAMHQLIDMINQLPEKNRHIALLDAVALEQSRGERPAYGWLCNSGNNAIRKALASGKAPQEVQPTAASDREHHLVVDTSGVAPDYVPDKEWKQLRSAILDRIVHSIAAQ